MKKIGVITFDFTKNRAKLGKTWVDGAGTFHEKELRLSSPTKIPPRSENTFTVRCNADLAFVPLDFEPRKLPRILGVYMSHSRVVPSVAGDVSLCILNVTEKEVELRSRTRIGKITKPCEILSSTLNTTGLVDQKANVTVTDDIHIEDTLLESQKLAIGELIENDRDIFSINPKKPNRGNVLEHKIISETENPVLQKPRKIPNAWNKGVDKQITEMLQNDIIRPSSSPWNSPLLLVKKKDNTTRFVCDFRGLNDVTKKDKYPLPNIGEMIDKMQGDQYWTKLDAASAYWSISLRKSDKEKTSFSVPNGTYEFNVTPYGLCSAGASYQRLMDIYLSGLPNERILAYMDGVIIFSTAFSEHIASLEEVLERFRATGISLKASKCEIDIDFLGFRLSHGGIRPRKELTNSIV